MTSLNISLPEALKEYVGEQVASGDWGTPSEYVRELIRQDKDRRLGDLAKDLIAATRRSTIEISVADIREKGLIGALRDHARRAEAERRAAKIKSRVRRAQRRIRKYVKPGVSLADELIAERRGAARND